MYSEKYFSSNFILARNPTSEGGKNCKQQNGVAPSCAPGEKVSNQTDRCLTGRTNISSIQGEVTFKFPEPCTSKTFFLLLFRSTEDCLPQTYVDVPSTTPRQQQPFFPPFRLRLNN